MASLVPKRRGDRTYWYVVESGRVGGKPRIVDQRYVGTSEEVIARLAGSDPGMPDRTQHRRFGDLAAAWSIIEELDVAGTVDQVVGPLPAGTGVSVGTYIALAIANRVVDPCSKRAFADWWAKTAGPRMLEVPAAALDHRRFWDAMDALTEAGLAEIETRLTRSVIDVFGLDPEALVLDMTNFATFIDSDNPKAPIAQRGKAKQKRTDLRLIGMGLIITSDGGVPLLSRAYPGDKPDVTQFAAMIDGLVGRYRDLFAPAEVTITFDAGQNSEPNFAYLTELGIGFVGSVPPSHHPDLLALPRSARQVVDPDRFGALTALEARADVLGGDRRVILTHSPTLHARQRSGFDQTLAKATRALEQLADRLARGNTRRARPGVQTDIDRITKPRWVARVITTELTGQQPKDLRLSWRIDDDARAELEEEIFGKRILVTGHEHWPTADVITAYRAQSDVEAGFRQLKDPHVVSFSPMFHWTDHKIRVHLFTCVLALTVAHLMRRRAAAAGMPMSVRELLATLEGIQETVLLYQPERGRPRARRQITDTTPTQQRLHSVFDLGRYAPRR